jgi:hypothetical protein
MQQSTIVLKAANAIVSNIANTEEIGLINGKIALCIFFYRLSLKECYKAYSRIATILFKDVIIRLQTDTMAHSISQLAEVGVGVLELYDAGFFAMTDINGIIHQIDNNVLKRPYFFQSSARNYNRLDIFYQGIYIHKRQQHQQFELENEYIQMFITKVKRYLESKDESRLYWSVMKYVFNELYNNYAGMYDCIEIIEMSDHQLQFLDENTNEIYNEAYIQPYLQSQFLLPELGLPNRFSSQTIKNLMDKEIQNIYYNKKNANTRISILANTYLT